MDKNGKMTWIRQGQDWINLDNGIKLYKDEWDGVHEVTITTGDGEEQIIMHETEPEFYIKIGPTTLPFKTAEERDKAYNRMLEKLDT